MKITYIQQHFHFPHEPGGQRPWQFAKRLAAAGDDVTVICGGTEALDEKVEGVRVIRIGTPYSSSMSTRQRISAFLEFMVKASSVALRTKPDIYFASSTPLTTAVPGLLAAKLRRKSFVFEVRDLWPSVPIELGALTNPVLVAMAKLLERTAYAAADEIIALSPGMAKGVRAVNSRTPITVIPNASDIEQFSKATEIRHETRVEMGWDDSDIVIMYAGSFGLTYDIDWIVQLGDELNKLDPRYKVRIYGGGAAEPSARALAQRLGMNPATILPGRIAKAEVERILPAADFAVSTLRDEPALHVNSLNKVFDALAASTPVIFNHAGWLPELLESNSAGVILSRAPKDAAKHFHSMILSGYDLAASSDNAFTLGQEQFARETLFSRFRKVIRRAAYKRSSRDNEMSREYADVNSL